MSYVEELKEELDELDKKRKKLKAELDELDEKMYDIGIEIDDLEEWGRYDPDGETDRAEYIRSVSRIPLSNSEY